MVKLVTKINGVAGMFIHTQHATGLEWFWRWRITSACPPGYDVWREGSSILPRVLFHPEIQACTVQAEWRQSADAAWSKAALHECQAGKARFKFLAKHDFVATEPIEVFSPTGGDMVACYRFHPFNLLSGHVTEREGRADGPFVDNILLEVGEFATSDPRLEVINTTLSEDSMMPSDADAVMVAEEGSSCRQVYALHPGGVVKIT